MPKPKTTSPPQTTVKKTGAANSRAAKSSAVEARKLKPGFSEPRTSSPDARDYSSLLGEVKTRIRQAQYDALKAVNRELVQLNWDIGRMIVKRQKDEKWGRAVVERLAKDLQSEFPGVSGFSVQNLWYMRQFYLAYRDNEKLQPMVGEIAWTHNILIMSKCKDDLQREFYIRMTRKFGWSKPALIRHIETQTYENTFTNQTNFDKTLAAETRTQAQLAVKDEYIFDFLELGDEYNERQLEQGLIANVEKFLREMGGVFTFVGSQYRLEIDDEEFFIDVLLYHRALKCMVAVELKVGKFQPEYVGKMQFYLAVLDERVRMPDENPSIGIILCKSKNKTIVEYALRESSKAIGIGAYRTFAALPQDLQKQLPAPEQVAQLMQGIE